MPIIEIKLIPIAVLKADFKLICFISIIVSRTIEVIKPLNIAKHITDSVDKSW
jgi:hypothetical protein